MPDQRNIWDREYQNPKLMTGGDKPQNDVLRFLKFLKKEMGLEIENLKILDLGSGTGRNANYLAGLGNEVIGFEISKTAISLAKNNATDAGVDVDYRLHNIGDKYDIENSSIDIVLDVTSSNSLDERGREVYIKEVHRVLKPSGYFFVRALCKDGNKNVKNLLKNNPGKEKDTYILKELNLTERVFSKDDFTLAYGGFFKILKLMKKAGYTRMGSKVYKRDYWLAYMQKQVV